MSINVEMPSCTICSKPLTRAAAVADDHGSPVHQKCYDLILKVKLANGDDDRAIRCPYCVEDHKFKLMKARANGEWFLCSSCGHATMPGHHTYRCNCPRCEALA
jgi:hypothetical protein